MPSLCVVPVARPACRLCPGNTCIPHLTARRAIHPASVPGRHARRYRGGIGSASTECSSTAPAARHQPYAAVRAQVLDPAARENIPAVAAWYQRCYDASAAVRKVLGDTPLCDAAKLEVKVQESKEEKKAREKEKAKAKKEAAKEAAKKEAGAGKKKGGASPPVLLQLCLRVSVGARGAERWSRKSSGQ